MSLTTKIYSLLSLDLLSSLEKSRSEPSGFQKKLFEGLIASGRGTSFGEEHNFEKIFTLKEFQKAVPLREYDDFEPYIERVRRGENSVLWNKPIKWFAKSSGTSSSKSKFIPITDDSLHKCHYSGMKKMLATYVANNPESALFDGDALTLGGSVVADELGTGNSYYGDLSAIMLKNSPFWVEMRRVPNIKTALIPDFEQKVEEICRSAHKYNVTSFSGVPSWNLILLRRILEHTGVSTLRDIWPNLELFMHGGINFEPYKREFSTLIPGSGMNYMESYNASEGYFAFQDRSDDPSMLLLTENGIFYEFIPLERLSEALSGRYTDFETVESVKVGVNYAMVITTNGGLWRYLIGDCILFTSLSPHKILITGRTQLFINTFGEELMINNAEKALSVACEKHNVTVTNYTVAPLFMDGGSKGSHQWLIEFDMKPSSLEAFSVDLDSEICKVNSDYEAKRKNSVTMVAPQVIALKNGTFYEWMRSRGKLGGQNKVPRLSGNRDYAIEILAIQDALTE
ncbi:MAG: GH3 auxin-responsive promoter family protein [Bacteroidales bacterium]|nr:GH3 auxin-responsive promoter family protein [Bacteroidales bacterium]